MRNLILMSSILAMVSCSSSEEECTSHETHTDGIITITENTEETTKGDTLDLTEIETVEELLDTLESSPSTTVTE